MVRLLCYQTHVFRCPDQSQAEMHARIRGPQTGGPTVKYPIFELKVYDHFAESIRSSGWKYPILKIWKYQIISRKVNDLRAENIRSAETSLQFNEPSKAESIRSLKD